MSEILEISYIILKKNLSSMIINLSTKESTPKENLISSSIRSLTYLNTRDLKNLIKTANIELAHLNLKYSIQNNILTIKKEKP